MITKREERIIKKIIRHRHTNSSLYKVDKYLKFSRVKVKEASHKEEIEGGNKYRVKYQYGLNLLNPISWIFILYIIVMNFGEVLVEIIGDLKASNYNDTISVRSKSEK